jgi:cation:H+ antiporter
MSALLVALGLAAVATGVIWKGSEHLERSAGRLSKHYGLPVAVHGAVVVAVPDFRSSAPSSRSYGG